MFEWKSTGTSIDTANEKQIAELNALREKAVAQSGLTQSELNLIYMCRRYGIFTKVNTYAHKIKSQ